MKGGGGGEGRGEEGYVRRRREKRQRNGQEDRIDQRLNRLRWTWGRLV